MSVVQVHNTYWTTALRNLKIAISSSEDKISILKKKRVFFRHIFTHYETSHTNAFVENKRLNKILRTCFWQIFTFNRPILFS